MTNKLSLLALLLASLLSATSSSVGEEPLATTTSELRDQEEEASFPEPAADGIQDTDAEVTEVVPEVEDYENDERELQYLYSATAAAPVYGAYGAVPVAYGGVRRCGMMSSRCGFAYSYHAAAPPLVATAGAVATGPAVVQQSSAVHVQQQQQQRASDPTVIVLNADSGGSAHTHYVHEAPPAPRTVFREEKKEDPVVVFIENRYGMRPATTTQSDGNIVYEYGSDNRQFLGQGTNPDRVTVVSTNQGRGDPSYVTYSSGTTGATYQYSGTRGYSTTGRGYRE